MKNYYNILGITDDEKKLKGKDFEKVLKPKYRKLAMEFHPDKQQGKSDSEKKAAEDKFKEISEAYEVLSNDEKRAKYDSPTQGGMNFDFGGFDINDIFRDFGGFGMNFNSQRNDIHIKGQSQRIKIGITLDDVLNGGKKTIRYKRYDKCKTCNGSGTTKESKMETCPHCGGTGQIFSESGGWQQIKTCPHCKGKGTILTHPCHDCNGNGIVATPVEVVIDIPKGVRNDCQQVIRGMGNAPLNCHGEYGDLLINFVDVENDKFDRYGETLVTEIKINAVDALLGCKKEVDTVDGKKIIASIPPGVENGMKFKFSGKGLPYYEDSSKRGDMFGIINVTIPKNLSEKEKELLRELKKCDSFNK